MFTHKFTSLSNRALKIFDFRDKSDNPAAYLYPFFGEGAYRTYGINKQFVPRKLSLSFDIKTFDEDSLIYLAITVSI